MGINIKSIIEIKEGIIDDITKIVNEQLRLIELVKAKEIQFDVFKKQFMGMEDEKNNLISIREDCNLLIYTYAEY